MATPYGASRRIMLACVLAIASTAAPSQPGKPMPALSRIEPGLWEIREINTSTAPQSICISDPDVLIQLRHRQAPCSRFVIANEAQVVTVHYTCPANGYGRTSVRVETPRLAKIDTQGIADNAPFAYRAEARRIGPCAGASRVSGGKAGR